MAKSATILFLILFSCVPKRQYEPPIISRDIISTSLKRPTLCSTCMTLPHDFATGSNITDIYRVNMPAEHLKLTEAYNWDSPQVGRAGGIYTNSISAVETSADFHLLLSLVFNHKEYNGSTLEIQGSDRIFFKYREVSVVSGTGKFWMASGFAVSVTAFLDIPNVNAVLRWNLTVFHY